MKDAEARLRDLEAAIDHLRRRAAGAAVLVEGRRDAEALERLGVGGQHVLMHRGAAIEARIDRLAVRCEAEAWPRLVLLLDWDRTGGRLTERMRAGLAGRVPLDMDCRRRIAISTRARTVEAVPADLEALRRQAGLRQ